MHPYKKARGSAGVVTLVAGVALIGTTGPAFALGWALWAAGLTALLTAIPSAGENRRPAAVTPLPSGTTAFRERRAA
jgi:hypothetical protein